MRPWIAVAYSAPVAAATAVFLIYPIGQGSFSDGYKKVALLTCWYAQKNNGGLFLNIKTIKAEKSWGNPKVEFYLKGEYPIFFISILNYFISNINDCFNRKKKAKKKRNIKANNLGNIESPGSGNNHGNEHDPNKKKDDPLLKNNNPILSGIKTGQRIKLNNYQVNSVKNIAGVYCIFCNKAGKYYVGESKNLKNRFMQHLTELKENEHHNSEMQNDFNFHTISSFEFIIVNSTLDLEDWKTRVDLQNNIIADLKSLGICYNTGYAETKTPRFQGEYPSNAGVFFFRRADIIYYGYSGQRGGISARIRSMISQLNQNSFSNKKLQADWTQYGAASFEIIPYDWGNRFSEVENCEELVNQLIYQRIQSNKEVYNVFYAPANSQQYSVSGPPPNERTKCNPTPMVNKTLEGRLGLILDPPLDLFPNAKPIRLGGSICVTTMEGVFLSISEAARFYGVTFRAIKTKLDSIEYNYNLSTTEEIKQELIRRNWSIKPITTIKHEVNKLDNFDKKKGRPRPMVVDGKWYPNIVAVAKAYGLTPQAVKKWPKTRLHDAYYPDEHLESSSEEDDV